jgi:hypothetical protein
MQKCFRVVGLTGFLLTALLATLLVGCGGGGYGGGGGVIVPASPTALTATAGNAQVALTWNASAGATTYYVKRATTTGGSYTQIGTPTSTNFTDTGLTNGVTPTITLYPPTIQRVRAPIPPRSVPGRQGPPRFRSQWTR